MRALLYFGLHPKRLLTLIGGIFGVLLSVWFAAVRAVPGVRERRAAARHAWQTRVRKRP